MCNAFNHHDSCECGFGPRFGSSIPLFKSYSSYLHSKSDYKYNKPLFDELYEKLYKEDSEYSHSYIWPPPYSLTIPVKCRYCNSQIYIHTNGFGDTVLFDPPLGPPWEKHNCDYQFNDVFKKNMFSSFEYLRDKYVDLECIADEYDIIIGIVVGINSKTVSLIVNNHTIDLDIPPIVNEKDFIKLGQIVKVEYVSLYERRYLIKIQKLSDNFEGLETMFHMFPIVNDDLIKHNKFFEEILKRIWIKFFITNNILNASDFMKFVFGERFVEHNCAELLKVIKEVIPQFKFNPN